MSKNKKKTFCGSLNAIKLLIVLPGEPPGCFDVAASFSFHALGRHPSPFCEHPYSILYFQPSSSQSDLQIFLGFLTASTTDLRGNLLPQSHNISLLWRLRWKQRQPIQDLPLLFFYFRSIVPYSQHISRSSHKRWSMKKGLHTCNFIKKQTLAQVFSC